MKYLKYLRRIFAALFFAPILLFFLDFTGKLPQQIHHLLELQWIPALMSLSLGVSFFLLVLSLFFGRLYCSVICPLGVFQDIAAWKSSWFRQKKKKNRFRFAKPQNALRYTILTLTLVVFLFGSSLLVITLDPYSIFGRIFSQLLYPIVIWVNNLLVDPLASVGNYSLYRVEQLHFVPLAFTISAIFFVVVSAMAWVRGRLYCNTICPVGTFLGLLSKFSLFRINIEETSCTQCGLCEKRCKSQCIDSLTMKVDDSRCVSCYNCLSVCKKGGVKYDFRYANKKEAKPKAAPVNTHRRTFIFTTGAVVAGLATAKAQNLGGKKDSYLTRKPIMPPGAGSMERFNTKCTGCQLCVSKCPMQVLKPAAMQYGISGIMQPHLAFSTHVYCNYECTVCSNVCPTGALKSLKVDEKKVTQIGVAQFRKTMCVVYTDNKDCGACSEHCPTQAVHMIPYKNGLTIPEVTADLCIGCGGCESICPVHPNQAIYVEGVANQVKAKKPVDAKKFVKKVEDFGF